MSCPPLASKHVTVTCEAPSGRRRGVVACDAPVPVGTVARYRCRQYYEPASPGGEGNTHSICLRNGSWSRPPLRCRPECGRMGQEVLPLIVNGQPAQYGLWPWQSALYVLQSGNYTFWCGGSLINQDVILTAAHCTWNIKTENLRVALGKYYRDFDKIQDMTQIREIKEVIMQPAYQDLGGHYGSDIALLVMKTPVDFTAVVRPVCIDWKLESMDAQLQENNTGMILGWGVNENDTVSESLRMTKLKVVGPEHCIQHQSRDFKKYVTYTSFCAGFANGTGVCNGDSGGGLVFQVPNNNGTWVVHGLVSVSPRRRGTSFCDPHKYTIFTKVGMYIRWLKEVFLSLGYDY